MWNIWVCVRRLTVDISCSCSCSKSFSICFPSTFRHHKNKLLENASTFNGLISTWSNSCVQFKKQRMPQFPFSFVIVRYPFHIIFTIFRLTLAPINFAQFIGVFSRHYFPTFNHHYRNRLIHSRFRLTISSWYQNLGCTVSKSSRWFNVVELFSSLFKYFA